MQLIKTAWKSFLRSETTQAITAMFGSNIMITIITAIGAFIQGRFVSPEDLGYFRQFGIISGYLFFLHLGVFHAIERLYPYYIGRGERTKAGELVEVGNSWMIIVCIPLTLTFIGMSILSFTKGNWKGALGWLVQAYMIVHSLYGGFLAATYRSGQDFKKMAKNNIIGPLLSIISWPLFWVQSYIALFLKNITGIFSLLKLYKNRPIKCSWRFTWKEWLMLVKQGFPRFMASYVMSTGLDAIRATIIIQRLGTLELGYWSFAWMIMLMAMQLPQSITAVFVPKIVELYGSTNSPSKCLALCRKPVIAGMVLLGVIVPIGLLGTITVLPVILPNYSEAVGIINILIFTLPLMLIEAPATILNAMNWIGWINVCAITNMIFQVLVMVLGLGFGWGLYSMAIGVFIGRAARVIMIWLGLLYASMREKQVNK